MTWLVTSRSEDKRQAFAREVETRREKREREEEARDRQAGVELKLASGAARVMQSEFSKQESALSVSLENAIWPPPEDVLDVSSRLSLEDLKLVASLLTPEEWIKIDVAQFGVKTIMVQRAAAAEQHLGEDHWIIPLGDESAASIKQVREAVDNAAHALSRLARAKYVSI